MTQDQMAELIGVEKNTLWRWENNKSTPDANALAKIYSVSVERGISPLFFKGKGAGRNRLLVMWDFQNMGVPAINVAVSDAGIKKTLNELFPSMVYRKFKAFAHTSQSAATDELERFGWSIWEDAEDLDEDLIRQSLSDCGHSPSDTILVLITKDGDYAELVEKLSGKGVRIYLIAPDGASNELLNAVGNNRWIKWTGPFITSAPRTSGAFLDLMGYFNMTSK